MDPLFATVSEQITLAVKEAFGVDLVAPDVASEFAVPPKIELGHLAYPCFLLAKSTQKKPNEISASLAALLKSQQIFSDAKAAGPYLNLYLKPEVLANTVIEPILSGAFFKRPSLSIQPVMVEYSQPNTHKELHVGHMRNLCFGLSLVKLLKYSGRPVLTTTFPGDVGTHVAKCLWYLKYHNSTPVPQSDKGVWLGRMYSAAHNKLEDERNTPLEEKNRVQLTSILKELEQKSGEFYNLWKETRQWSIDLMESVYRWAGVAFDKWFWESDVDSPSVEWVKKLYSEGKLQISEGAIGYDLTEENLGFCLLLKSDGNGLYATKDLELARRKFELYNPSLCIVIVDMRQELHFKQVFAVLKKLGMESQSERCLHLKYNFVELPDGAMSSRKGNIVPITDLIEQMKAHVKSTYLTRYENEWSAQEIEATSDMVAQGAIKYGMNSMDMNKKIVFKMEDWLKLDGESGPYIQYTHARINSLLEKNPVDKAVAFNSKFFTEPIELELLLKLAQFNRIVESCAQNLRTAPLCTYVYELAKVFNSFYHDCPIGKLENREHRKARLELSRATKEVLAVGLGLLAIPAPPKM